MNKETFANKILFQYDFLIKSNFVVEIDDDAGSSGPFRRVIFKRNSIEFSFSLSFTVNGYYRFGKREYDHQTLCSMLKLKGMLFPGFFDTDDSLFEAIYTDFKRIHEALFYQFKSDGEIIEYVNSLIAPEGRLP